MMDRWRRLTFLALALFPLFTAACQDPPTRPTPLACAYALTASRDAFEAAGGTGSIAVTTDAGCAWTAVVDASWITIVSGASGVGSGEISVRVEANAAGDQRSAGVRIAGQTCAIHQEGASCTYTVTPAGASFAATGGVASVAVATREDCRWTTRCGAPWVTILSGAEGQGSGTVSYSVAPHAASSERRAELTIAGESVAISQAGAATPEPACIPVLRSARETVGAAGGSGFFAVDAPEGCRWTASSRDGWITVASPRRGEGVGSARVEYEVAPNLAAGWRTGSIAVGDARFVIEQAGTAGCEYSVSTAAVDLTFYGCAACQVELRTSNGCPWTAASGAEWLQLIGPAQGSQSAFVRFRVDTYTGLATRRAPILIRWPTPSEGQNVWVTQSGCTYILMPTRLDFAASGGTGTFRVWSSPVSSNTMAACPWRTEADVSWIRILSAQGSDEGPVRFEVAPNLGRQPREGGIRVEHARFVVAQAGTSP
jgi:hypothetical protein